MNTHPCILLLAAALAGLAPVHAITPEEGKQIYMEAKAGKAEAQYRLGFCYLKGDGVSPSIRPRGKKRVWNCTNICTS